MSKITDMVVSAILKKGIIGEFHNFETKISAPNGNSDPFIITIKAENLKISLAKE